MSRWVIRTVRILAGVLSIFFFIGTGFRGAPFVSTIAGLLVAASALAIAVVPGGALIRSDNRNACSFCVSMGLVGGLFGVAEAFVVFEPPDEPYAAISAVAMLILASGFVRLMPDGVSGSDASGNAPAPRSDDD